MTKVYLDSDGVLMDFDGGLLQNYGIKNDHVNYQTPNNQKTPEQWELVYKIRKVMSTPGFFENLPVMKGAEELFAIANDAIILTAVPGQGHDEQVASEKRSSLKRAFNGLTDDRIITCLRSEKAKYATYHGGVGYGWTMPNILVDDIESNIKQWKEAGGIGILFTSMEQACEDLKRILNVGK